LVSTKSNVCYSKKLGQAAFFMDAESVNLGNGVALYIFASLEPCSFSGLISKMSNYVGQ